MKLDFTSNQSPSEISNLRANARFFIDAFRLSLNHLTESKDGQISSQAIPGFVSMLFAAELILKLAVLTDLFLEDPTNFVFKTEIQKLRKPGHKFSMIIKARTIWHHPDLKEFFISNSIIKVFAAHDHNFLKLRYFYEDCTLSIDVKELSESSTKLLNLIYKIHKESGIAELRLN